MPNIVFRFADGCCGNLLKSEFSPWLVALAWLHDEDVFPCRTTIADTLSWSSIGSMKPGIFRFLFGRFDTCSAISINIIYQVSPSRRRRNTLHHIRHIYNSVLWSLSVSHVYSWQVGPFHLGRRERFVGPPLSRTALCGQKHVQVFQGALGSFSWGRKRHLFNQPMTDLKEECAVVWIGASSEKITHTHFDSWLNIVVHRAEQRFLLSCITTSWHKELSASLLAAFSQH